MSVKYQSNSSCCNNNSTPRIIDKNKKKLKKRRKRIRGSLRNPSYRRKDELCFRKDQRQYSVKGQQEVL
jgi:hypothetical protein